MTRQRNMTRTRQTVAIVAFGALAFGVLGACGGDDGAEPGTSAPQDIEDVVAGAAFPDSRCVANRAAGPITFLSSFDFAATASIVEVLVAEQRGYFDDLCLDVTVKPSFSTTNYPLIAANDAQFSSGGSFSEVLNFANANDAEFVVLAVEGHTAIDSLIVKEGEAETLEDLRGTTIGVKGKITPSVAAMLAGADLIEGRDYETVLIEGFDPLVHIELPDIVGFPGYKSNEPGQLERAGVPFTLFDPSEFGVPGSFGIIYTNATFLTEHPTAAEDFMRAAMKGLAESLADPAAASAVALALINANGNPNFLSPEGEVFRWQVEAQLILDTTPQDSFPGVPHESGLQAEVDAYHEIGLFGDTAPAIEGRFDPDLVRGLYGDDGSVVWPAFD
ncbi:MAG: ABC transporter substrate-binding protein [Ilumatobacteraceae bacterium]